MKKNDYWPCLTDYAQQFHPKETNQNWQHILHAKLFFFSLYNFFSINPWSARKSKVKWPYASVSRLPASPFLITFFFISLTYGFVFGHVQERVSMTCLHDIWHLKGWRDSCIKLLHVWVCCSSQKLFKKWRIYGLLFLEILALQNCEEFIRLHPHSRLL